jgi:hypothetical protein
MIRTIGRPALAIVSLALVAGLKLTGQPAGLPSTADGKQYIVVAVSGGIYSGEYIAFSLPNAPRSTSVGQQ